MFILNVSQKVRARESVCVRVLMIRRFNGQRLS